MNAVNESTVQRAFTIAVVVVAQQLQSARTEALRHRQHQPEQVDDLNKRVTNAQTPPTCGTECEIFMPTVFAIVHDLHNICNIALRTKEATNDNSQLAVRPIQQRAPLRAIHV
jgi:hypothetical protein